MESRRPRVLLVAEPNNLRTMAEALESKAALGQAQNEAEALQRVLSERFDLCIVDLHLSGSSGLELVKAIRANHPEIGRILVSDFADTAELVRAINQGEIFRFVPRPCTALQLQSAVDEFLRSRRAQAHSDLVLVADDSRAGRTVLEQMLKNAGFRVESVADGQLALAALKERSEVAVALIDLEMPGMSGLEVVQEGRQIAPEVPFIILSAHVQHQIALDCLASGAFDFIPKPFSLEVLLFRVKRALNERRKADELLALRASRGTPSKLVATSPAMRTVVAKVPSLAASEETVLITGETGAGKEAVAREVHRLSRRSGEQFFSVNCGALTETLLESELFGHEKGAFTGAIARRKGLFEMAHGGTLFLDELGEMTPSTQVKLLRVLEERKFVRVGGSQQVHVDVRLIAATNADLKQMVEAKTFRADLFYRLLVLPLHLPPLRERPEDIPLLLQAALVRAAPNRAITVSPSALAEASAYAWPGNVRELINAVARAIAMTPGDRIDTLWLDVKRPEQPAAAAGPLRALKEHMAQAEREYLEALLHRTGGNLGEAAELAEVDRKSIYNKMKAYGLNKDGFK